MPRPTLTAEERLGRKTERQQARREAQRERVRQQTLTEASQEAHVRILALTDTGPASEETAQATGSSHLDIEPRNVLANATESAQRQLTDPPAVTTLEAEGTAIHNARYGLRTRTSKSPTPTASSRDGPSATEPTTAAATAAAATDEAPWTLALALQLRSSADGTVNEAGLDKQQGQGTTGGSTSRVRKHREEQRNLRRQRLIEEAQLSSQVRVLHGPTDTLPIGRAESSAIEAAPTGNATDDDGEDPADETLTITRPVIYVSTGSPEVQVQSPAHGEASDEPVHPSSPSSDTTSDAPADETLTIVRPVIYVSTESPEVQSPEVQSPEVQSPEVQSPAHDVAADEPDHPSSPASSHDSGDALGDETLTVVRPVVYVSTESPEVQSPVRSLID